MTRSSAQTPMPHDLSGSQLNYLTRGEIIPAAVRRLVAAQSSKHRLLLEKVRRQVVLTQSPENRILVERAIELIAEVEASSAEIAERILTMPQVGAWAIRCLRRMSGLAGGQARDTYSVPLRNDLGYLMSVAVAGALRIRHPVDIEVPLYDGRLLLPGMGAVHTDSSDPWGIVRVQANPDHMIVVSPNATLVLPSFRDLTSYRSSPQWSPVRRLRAIADGLALDVALDNSDPFFESLGQPAATLSVADHEAWQLSLQRAWQILVEHHRGTAAALAAGVSTLVPFTSSATNHPRSTTSGWIFGAIGLSLPSDEVALAEIFAHELQHLVLGAVEDMYALVVPERDTQLGYAPWRDDPRPASGLLHGSYAYLGLTAFWRRQRKIGRPEERFRCEVEFARWRAATLETASKLIKSPALSDIGQRFARGIRDQLVAWRNERVAARAERLAAEMRAEHQARWHLNHLRPKSEAVDALARSWLSGAAARLDSSSTDPSLEPGRALLSQGRAYLLEARYRDLGQIQQLTRAGDDATGQLGMPDDADAALLHNDNATAMRGYLSRLRTADDNDAWVGLAIVLWRSGPTASARLLVEKPELVAALYSRLRGLADEMPDADSLLAWLGRSLTSTVRCATGEW